MDAEDREVIESLLISHPLAASEDGRLPDEGLIAGYVEGRLTPEMHSAVEAQLLASTEGRALVAELSSILERRDGQGAPALLERRGSWRALAIAAVLLLGVGAWLYATGAFRSEADPGPDARLLTAAAALTRHAPALFDDFRPLGAGERAGGTADVLRGGIQAYLPQGRTLEARPTFRWRPVAGATRYDVEVLDDRGGVVYAVSSTGSQVDYAADHESLERGRTYVWEVSTDEGPLGRVTGRRSFHVASEAEAARFEQARRQIAEHAPQDLRAVLLSHVAIRWGLLATAERLVEERLQQSPADEVASQTRSYLHRVLGLARGD